MTAGTAAAAPGRTLLIGSHSHLWRTLARDPRLRAAVDVAMSHDEARRYDFRPGDRVWVFAYSRRPGDNQAMLDALRARAVSEVRYVSSSSTIVCSITHCYEYPRVKAAAEQLALTMPGGRILTLGLVYETPTDLPAGDNIATSFSELAAFMLRPEWTHEAGRRRLLFRRVARPFGSGAEALMFRLYDRLLGTCGRFPCLLRPVDLALRICGYRWYGYTRLSNRLWSTTTSS